jgi:Domain of unknown function (DUF6438)
MKSRFPLLAILAIAAGCLTVSAGEIQDLFTKALKDGQAKPTTQYAQFDDKPAPTGITEFGIERTECYGDCPAYTFIIKADGTFRYHGQSHLKRLGDFTGKIDPWYVNHLMAFIKDSGYINLNDQYRAAVTDLPTVYTTVVMDGKRKTISDYAGAGPPKLWAIETLIDGLLADAQWDQKTPTTKP